METLITIAEATHLTGKHRDTIRKWTKEHPNGVKKTEDGKRRIIAEMLALDYAIERKEPRKIDIEPSEDQTALRSEIEALKRQNEALVKQNAEMLKKNDALTDRLAGFADALIKLADQQQQLTAQVNQQLMLTAKTEEPKRRFGLFRKK
jgi:hypothetical protein